MIRSIRGRIVLGSVAIAAAVLALLGVVVFEQLRHIAGAAVVTLAQEELRPFVADGLAMLDGLVRRSGPSVRYDYRTGRTVMVPPLRERVERPPE